MQQFTDTKNRTWDIVVTVHTIEQVRRLCDIDLAALDGELFSRLQSDPVTLANILFVVCSDAAKSQDITDEDFGRSLGGDVLDEATSALLEALCNFFPRSRREAIRAAWNQFTKIEQMATTHVVSKITDDRIGKAVMTSIDREIDNALANLTGNRKTTPIKNTTKNKTLSKPHGK